MEKHVKHYVEFIGKRGNKIEQIALRDPKLIRVRPKWAFAYRFFDIAEIIVDGETFVGEKKNISSWTYFASAYWKKSSVYGKKLSAVSLSIPISFPR